MCARRSCRSRRRTPARCRRPNRRTASRRQHASDAWSARPSSATPDSARKNGCSHSRRPCSAAVFLPQQLQRHAAALQLLVDVIPIGQRSRRPRPPNPRREQPPLQRRIVDLGRHRPGDADVPRTPQVLADRRSAEANGERDPALAQRRRRASVAGLLGSSASALSRRASDLPCITAKGAACRDLFADSESLRPP